MIDMSKWPTESADVLDELRLDPRNVRLGLEGSVPEADIMADLFANAKALKLVDSIVKVGYLTHEVPIALKRRRQLVVVEGNRRLAALKAIQNPFLVPEFQARITKLTEGFEGRDDLRSISIKIAPNQRAADQLVAALHTGNPREPWSPTRQAAFFQAQIDAGATLQRLRTDYPTVRVERYVLRSAIVKRFQRVRYSDPEVADFVSGGGLQVSTLARLYEAQDFTALVSLRLDEEGNLTCKVSAPVFDEMARVIAKGMHAGDITTRTLNDVGAPVFTALMTQLTEIAVRAGETVPDTEMDGEDDVADTGSNSEADAGGSPPPRPAKPRPSAGRKPSPSPSKDKQLDVSGLRVPRGFPPSIKAILGELTTLDIEVYPNAAMDLIRTFLEKTIKAFSDTQSEPQRIKQGGGYVYLSHCLAWAETWFRKNGPRSAVQVVKLVRSFDATAFGASYDFLNAINHNHKVVATPDRVRHMWLEMRPLMDELLK